jgi:iron complex outermembrane receptor protein
MKLKLISSCTSLVTLATVMALPITASAQVLEEIVVSAQKREENLQDVPISVTAFTGEQLDALGITDFTEITQQIPALQLNAWSPNLTIFNLRGISQNSFNDNLEGPVAVYMDDQRSDVRYETRRSIARAAGHIVRSQCDWWTDSLH